MTIGDGEAECPPGAHPGKRAQAGWALYDWANSPFTTLILTFVFAAYFGQGVVGDGARGQALWGTMMAVAGLAFALSAPVLGALADARGPLKPWVAGMTILCAGASIGLWWVVPEPSAILLALLLVAIGTIGFEYGAMFANALLPEVAPPDRVGRLSGWAFGLGYGGGLAALVLALLVLIKPETAPFGLDKSAAEQVRIVGPLVGVWLLLFALPLLLWVPDRPRRRERGGLGRGLAALRAQLAALPRQRELFRFLLAFLFYNNGLLTLFGLGGVYAAGEFGMGLDEVISFGIALNVAAGIGAFLFGMVDDRLGSARTIVIALVGMMIAALTVVVAPDRTWLWVGGMGLGLFVGPVQASSRALMARLAPEDGAASHFGLFALAGRATAFVGPAVVAAVTAASGSQRWGIATILLFVGAGLALMVSVRGAAPQIRGTGPLQAP